MPRAHPLLLSFYAAILLVILFFFQCLAPGSQALAAKGSGSVGTNLIEPNQNFFDISDSNYPHGSYSATTDLCAACHRAHSRDNHAPGTSVLSSDLTSDLDSDLCYDCHTVETYASDAIELLSTNFRSDSVNLHASHAVYTGCTGCHDPHTNQQPFRLLIDQPSTQVPAIELSEEAVAGDSSSYWQTSTDGSAISCALSCHGHDHRITDARYPAPLEAR